jgi:hypothetical protein
MKKKLVGILVCTLLIAAGTIAVADWSPEDGHKMHSPQLPDADGWDVGFNDWWLADDWKCKETGTVDDIHFWISWEKDEVVHIPWIKIMIYSNNPGPPSTPRIELWKGEFSEDEYVIAGPWDGDQGWYLPPSTINPHDHDLYYQINIKNISKPFEQEEGIIYWLLIQMPLFTDAAVGWKTSEKHFEDAAVYGWPAAGWTPLMDPSSPNDPIDFAFVINGKEGCCFPAGTRITMADGSYKNIEDVKIGDRVLSYDIIHDRFTSWTVKMLGAPVHPVYEINDGLIRATKEHPLYIKKTDGRTGWGAVYSISANSVVRLKEDVLPLEVGDQLRTLEGEWIEVVKITFNSEPVKTYNLLSFSGRKTYFANDILVYEEHPPVPYMMKWRLEKFFERFPNAFPMLRYVLGL